MSVGDLHDVGRTGDFAVTRLRRRPKKQVPVDPTAKVSIAVLTEDAALADAIHDAAAANHPVATASMFCSHTPTFTNRRGKRSRNPSMTM